MNAIKARIRNGRIETDVPVELPEGTELLVMPISVSTESDATLLAGTPQGIRDWLAWYDTLEPLTFTAEERDAFEDEQKARKAWESAHAEERERKLRSAWE